MQQPESRIRPIEGSSGKDSTPKPPRADEAWGGPWPQSPADFEKLLETYLDRLVRYAFRQLGNLQDAEDVVQEVFIRAFRDRSKRKRISAVGPYLYRSVANACTDLLRKRNRAGVFREEIGIEELVSGGSNPSEVSQAAEELRRAEAVLRRLPQPQAEAIRLRLFDELRLSEIAEVVGCSVNTVGSRLRYGFQKLRRIVSEKPRIIS